MLTNNYKGKFIAFDGPNGVGKSTIIASVVKELTHNGYNVLSTKEPTDTELGLFTRSISETIRGNSLACLVAADRYEHLSNSIIPALENGDIVVCDRYILSSLILQRIDKVSKEFILEVNKDILIPDLQIAIYADAQTICQRLEERISLTRFEHGNVEDELKYLFEGINILKSLGINVAAVNNDMKLNDVVEDILYLITEKRGHF